MFVNKLEFAVSWSVDILQSWPVSTCSFVRPIHRGLTSTNRTKSDTVSKQLFKQFGYTWLRLTVHDHQSSRALAGTIYWLDETFQALQFAQRCRDRPDGDPKRAVLHCFELPVPHCERGFSKRELRPSLSIL